ncbi:MAG: hypothetical protein EOL88_12905 [Bacteroidia bacterium]|nr:hypothetical protein [Bacteroidia bacterium]
MPKIITLTPVWGRPEIFEICLTGIKRLMQRVDLHPVFAISEDWAADMLKGFDYIYHDNKPLGLKKNKLLEYIMQKDFDYLMQLDSDDIITNSYIDLITPYINNNTPQFCVNIIYFVDLSGNTAYFKTSHFHGLAMCISKQSIIKAGGILWDNNSNRGMDHYCINKLKKVGIENTIIPIKDICCLDIKSDTNINTINSFPKLGFSYRDLLRNFEEGDMVINLIEKNNV